MHIPRQTGRPGAARPGGADGAPARHAGPADVDGPAEDVQPSGAVADLLRDRRRHLVQRLRTLGYWQRLVQARTDLVVAGLLYNAPSPGTGLPAWPSATTAGEPPEGLDVARLLEGLDGAATVPGEWGTGPAGPGAHLERLRSTAVALSAHRRALQEDLDEVTTSLHEHLATRGTRMTPVVAARPSAR